MACGRIGASPGHLAQGFELTAEAEAFGKAVELIQDRTEKLADRPPRPCRRVG